MTSQHPAPLTLEEHRDLSREIHALDSRVQILARMMVDIYGPQNRAAFAFQRAAEATARLSDEMRAQATKDLQGYTVDGLYQ